VGGGGERSVFVHGTEIWAPCAMKSDRLVRQL